MHLAAWWGVGVELAWKVMESGWCTQLACPQSLPLCSSLPACPHAFLTLIALAPLSEVIWRGTFSPAVRTIVKMRYVLQWSAWVSCLVLTPDCSCLAIQTLGVEARLMTPVTKFLASTWEIWIVFPDHKCSPGPSPAIAVIQRANQPTFQNKSVGHILWIEFSFSVPWIYVSIPPKMSPD